VDKLAAGLVVVSLAASAGIGLGVGATANAADGPSTAKRPASAGTALAAVQAGEVSAQAAGAWRIGGGTLRLGGANRWETAEAVSQTFWQPENTLAVALVSGENFPDSLSLPPTMAMLGPTLLVQSRALPASTRAELQRLRPCYVVAAGGTAVISDAVLRDADQYADPTQPGCE
jgi:putative cell wall-binding protein